MTKEQGAVHFVAGKAGIRITLGGLKGTVPVSIYNPLDFAVKVRVRLYYSQATGVKIVEDPPVVTIPAGKPETIKLHVQATEVGSTTVTMRLENASGQLYAVIESGTDDCTGDAGRRARNQIDLRLRPRRGPHRVGGPRGPSRPARWPPERVRSRMAQILMAWRAISRAIRSRTARKRPATPEKEARRGRSGYRRA